MSSPAPTTSKGRGRGRCKEMSSSERVAHWVHQREAKKINRERWTKREDKENPAAVYDNNLEDQNQLLAKPEEAELESSQDKFKPIRHEVKLYVPPSLRGKKEPEDNKDLMFSAGGNIISEDMQSTGSPVLAMTNKDLMFSTGENIIPDDMQSTGSPALAVTNTSNNSISELMTLQPKLHEANKPKGRGRGRRKPEVEIYVPRALRNCKVEIKRGIEADATTHKRSGLETTTDATTHKRHIPGNDSQDSSRRYVKEEGKCDVLSSSVATEPASTFTSFLDADLMQVDNTAPHQCSMEREASNVHPVQPEISTSAVTQSGSPVTTLEPDYGQATSLLTFEFYDPAVVAFLPSSSQTLSNFNEITSSLTEQTNNQFSSPESPPFHISKKCLSSVDSSYVLQQNSNNPLVSSMALSSLTGCVSPKKHSPGSGINQVDCKVLKIQKEDLPSEGQCHFPDLRQPDQQVSVDEPVPSSSMGKICGESSSPSCSAVGKICGESSSPSCSAVGKICGESSSPSCSAVYTRPWDPLVEVDAPTLDKIEAQSEKNLIEASADAPVLYRMEMEGELLGRYESASNVSTPELEVMMAERERAIAGGEMLGNQLRESHVNASVLNGMDVSNDNLKNLLPAAYNNAPMLNRMDVSNEELEKQLPLTDLNAPVLDRMDVSDDKLEKQLPASNPSVPVLDRISENQLPVTVVNAPVLDKINVSNEKLENQPPMVDHSVPVVDRMEAEPEMVETQMPMADPSCRDPEQESEEKVQDEPQESEPVLSHHHVVNPVSRSGPVADGSAGDTSVPANPHVPEDNSPNLDSWDAMFDDNGDCLEESLMEELTEYVGKVKIDQPKINYLNYEPKEPNFDFEAFSHILEIYDFPPELATCDLVAAFREFASRGFDVKWVDDTHALGVFSSAVAANEALRMVHPLMKVRPLSAASRQGRSKARHCHEFLQPYKVRPETTSVAARRLVAGALGMTTRISREEKEREKQKLTKAKEKRRQEKQQKLDIWDGSFGKCAMDEES